MDSKNVLQLVITNQARGLVESQKLTTENQVAWFVEPPQTAVAWFIEPTKPSED